MSGRGRRASLPSGGYSRPESLVADGQGGLVVRHYNREGKVREYDFAELPVAGPMQASLAALFAARCTPGRWTVHVTSAASWHHLRRFTESLARRQRPPRDLDELTPVMVRAWRAGLPAGAGGGLAFGAVTALLRDDARLQAGPVADELGRRFRVPRSKVQSYSEAEFSQFTTAARRRFRAALQRINENARHLQQWRDGAFAEGCTDWVLGEGLDILARTGDLPRRNGRSHGIEARHRDAFGGPDGPAPWERLFLTGVEAAALGVLLMAEFGWNLSVIDRAAVPLASPDQGEDGRVTYRIALEKPRRGRGRYHETRNVTDEGAGTPGRLVTQALQATRFARAIVEELAPGSSRLIVWRAGAAGGRRANPDHLLPVGPFCFGIHADGAKRWAEAEGLGSSPFRRGRRTVIALDRREPAQHSQGTHDRQYVLPDERVRAEAVEVIAAGAEDAAGRARRTVLAARLRDQPGPGDIETATTDCSGYHDSPWPSREGGCGASFLMCLACPNARVHPGRHPRLAHLHEALGSLRSVLPPAAWAADWRDSHDRLEDLRQRIGEGPWALALARVTETDRALVGHLLTGALDA
ncbi:MAG: hypothetical protein ACRDNT_20945 [Streptosporangiaceae bacterium]